MYNYAYHISHCKLCSYKILGLEWQELLGTNVHKNEQKYQYYQKPNKIIEIEYNDGLGTNIS